MMVYTLSAGEDKCQVSGDKCQVSVDNHEIEKNGIFPQDGKVSLRA